MTAGQQYLQFFGSDTLKRLHGCAIAEHDRGPDSPCHGLAQPLRRPQIGFGNIKAAVLFLSPSPLDATSTSNEAFNEWLDHEAQLEHHMTSHTPHPYFQFVRSVWKAARQRQGQPGSKNDVLECSFHSWAVRCATEVPDRVTQAALDQCVDRHLHSLLSSIAPQVVIAMGGPLARHLWWRTQGGWEGWGSMRTLHGRVLDIEVGSRKIPAILSVHPYQQGVDLHPEVIGRLLGDRLLADHSQAELKAA